MGVYGSLAVVDDYPGALIPAVGHLDHLGEASLHDELQTQAVKSLSAAGARVEVSGSDADLGWNSSPGGLPLVPTHVQCGTPNGEAEDSRWAGFQDVEDWQAPVPLTQDFQVSHTAGDDTEHGTPFD